MEGVEYAGCERDVIGAGERVRMVAGQADRHRGQVRLESAICDPVAEVVLGDVRTVVSVCEAAVRVQRQGAVLRALDEERGERQVVRIAVVGQNAERADVKRSADRREWVNI